MNDTVKAVSEQITTMATAGQVVAVDPDDADAMAAFAEDALSPEEAMESRFDDIAEGSE